MRRLLAFYSLLLLTACGPGTNEEVETLRIEEGSFKISLLAEGELRASESSSIMPPPGSRNPRTISWLAPNYSFVKQGEVVARFEVSFPIGLPEELGVFGGAFLDAGTLFGLDETSFPGTDITDSADFRAATGLLLFLDTPLGALELSFALPLIDEDFDDTEFFRLSVGTRF